MTTYTVPDNDAIDFALEPATPPSNDAVDFTLAEEPPPEPTPEETAFDPIDIGFQPLDLELDIDLQTVPLNVRSMETGLSTFLVGSMGLLLAGSWLSRNYLALTMWAMAFILLIMSGLFGIGLEFFWMGMVLTIILLVAGLIVRWGDM